MENIHFKQGENPSKSLINLFFLKPVLKAFQFVDTKNTATMKCVCHHLSALLVHTADRQLTTKYNTKGWKALIPRFSTIFYYCFKINSYICWMFFFQMTLSSKSNIKTQYTFI